MHIIKVPGRMPTLNQYRNTHHYKLNKEKKQWQEAIIWACKESKLKKTISTPFCIHLTQYTASKRDVDNCIVAIKYFMDALQKAGYIDNDNPDTVPFISMSWKKAKDRKSELHDYRIIPKSQYRHVVDQFV